MERINILCSIDQCNGRDHYNRGDQRYGGKQYHKGYSYNRYVIKEFNIRRDQCKGGGVPDRED